MDSGSSIKITHIITGLNIGGAETMLYWLLKNVDQRKFPCRVISLSDNGPIGEKLSSIGIPIIAVGLNNKNTFWSGLSRLFIELQTNKPVLIQTWMYHSDLLGGLVAKTLKGIRVVWGIHNSTLDLSKSKKSTRLVVQINAFLSHFVPDRIIVCSRVSERIHNQKGFDKNRMIFIPNGFDLSAYRADRQACVKVRDELGIASSEIVIGMAARFDPQKDHGTFFLAANELLKKVPNLQFVLCGDGVSWDNADIVSLIDSSKKSHFHLLGRRNDMPEIYASWDIAMLSSKYGEAFPLTIGEAMACEIPCVGTDVGDTSDLIGNTGYTVPTEAPLLLADAVTKLLSMSSTARSDLGKLAREQILSNYEISQIATKYQDVWKAAATRS